MPGGRLLENPNFGATPEATGDLEAGVVDERPVAALRVVAWEHRVRVEAFKESHQSLPGVPDAPRIPEGYGEAGGLPNTHYYGRAAGIWWVDAKPVEGNGTDPDVIHVGRSLADIPPQRRPDHRPARVAEDRNQIVEDVREIDNYLACSLNTRSELVVRMREGGRIVGQFDIDSDERAAFTDEDESLLEEIAGLIAPRVASLAEARAGAT